MENQDLNNEAQKRLEQIHNNLLFLGGNLRDEYPEQIMSVIFIKPDNKVLEIGSNLGRNTLTISSLLSDQNDLVTLECDPTTFTGLLYNRDVNKHKFRAENSALSYRPLVLNGWDSIPSDTVPPGYIRVNTITFKELETKYNIKFDTLVADCEGALYYILLDDPNLLDNISTFIMENDYHNLMHKITIDDILKTKNFKCVYRQAGGWGPCYRNFFEVWKK